MAMQKLDKSKKKLLIVLIIAGVLILVAAGFFLVSNLAGFRINSANKYVVMTDRKWKTMKNDGGSYESTYYEIDLDNNTVSKKEEIFDAGANLNSFIRSSSTEENTIYTKNFDDKLSRETKMTLSKLIAEMKADKETLRNCDKTDFSMTFKEYLETNCFTISTLGYEGGIISSDIEDLLKKYDNL